jgi:hypothetical protein
MYEPIPGDGEMLSKKELERTIAPNKYRVKFPCVFEEPKHAKLVASSSSDALNRRITVEEPDTFDDDDCIYIVVELYSVADWSVVLNSEFYSEFEITSFNNYRHALAYAQNNAEQTSVYVSTRVKLREYLAKHKAA